MKAKSALLILDMISEFAFPGATSVLRRARRPAGAIARLKERAIQAGIPIVYVNDTAGQWESDSRAFVERCCDETARGHDICTLLRPRTTDYFIFKPKHSGFYGTPLSALLDRLGVRRLILTGITVHQLSGSSIWRCRGIALAEDRPRTPRMRFRS